MDMTLSSPLKHFQTQVAIRAEKNWTEKLVDFRFDKQNIDGAEKLSNGFKRPVFSPGKSVKNSLNGRRKRSYVVFAPNK